MQADAFEVSNPPHFKYMLGEQNLGLLQEPRHSRVRAVIAPAFTTKRVAAALPRIAALCKRYLDTWATTGHLEAWNEQIKLFTLEVCGGMCAGAVPFARGVGRCHSHQQVC